MRGRRAGLADFVAAQDAVWPQVAAELAAGRKASHWMWFVFPQIEGLGRSETARFYALPPPRPPKAPLRRPGPAGRRRWMQLKVE